MPPADTTQPLPIVDDSPSVKIPVSLVTRWAPYLLPLLVGMVAGGGGGTAAMEALGGHGVTRDQVAEVLRDELATHDAHHGAELAAMEQRLTVTLARELDAMEARQRVALREAILDERERTSAPRRSVAVVE